MIRCRPFDKPFSGDSFLPENELRQNMKKVWRPNLLKNLLTKWSILLFFVSYQWKSLILIKVVKMTAEIPLIVSSSKVFHKSQKTRDRWPHILKSEQLSVTWMLTSHTFLHTISHLSHLNAIALKVVIDVKRRHTCGPKVSQLPKLWLDWGKGCLNDNSTNIYFRINEVLLWGRWKFVK